MEENNTVTINGMIGEDLTFFANSPVVVNVSNLNFPGESSIKVVRLKVLSDGVVVGEFPAEAADTESLSFDISSALRAIWADDDLDDVIDSAMAPITQSGGQIMPTRLARAYTLIVCRDYIDSTDGEYSTDESQEYAGGSCLPGGMTELERSVAVYEDVSELVNSNPVFGDASTKPITSPEMVGIDSITSFVELSKDGITSYFYDPSESVDAPTVLRDDSVNYIDFLFLNRRGAVETCSAQMLEAMNIEIDATQYALVERPSFRPKRSLVATATGGRRSWSMSSGHQTREWAEWWTMEFLMARKHWMRYNGTYVPVTVTPAKKQIGIYDRTKQQMPSVEFTVTLSLEG